MSNEDTTGNKVVGAVVWMIVGIVGFQVLKGCYDPVGYTSAVPISGVASQPREVSSTNASIGSQSFSGRGDGATRMFTLSPGLLRVSYSHNGTRHFSIVLYDGGGNYITLLANGSGTPMTGSQVTPIERGGQYVFNVQASDSWSIEIQ